MAKNSIQIGTSSYITELFLQDTGSIVGAGKAGLTFADLGGSFKRNVDSAHIKFNLADATIGTYTASGFKQVSSADMPGVYEFHVPDVALTGTAQSVVFQLTGTQIAPLLFELELTRVNNQNSGTFGVTNLESVYYADIQYIRDNSQDEYTVSWFKNGTRLLNGVTNPFISVFNRADGSNLFANSGLTEIGSIHSFKYDALENRQSSGNTYVAVASGTIDGLVRSDSALLGRDQ